jgi:membrane protease YdiL (CAAX protease family)
MIPFLDQWKLGIYGTKEVAQSLLLILLFFFLGNLPASVVFAQFGVTNLHQASALLGFHIVFLLQMIPFITVLLAFHWSRSLIHKVHWRNWVTVRTNPSIKRILWAFGFWSTFMVLSVLFEVVLNPQSLNWNFDPTSFGIALTLLLVFLPVQVLAEELLFRSYALQGLNARLKKPWLAICLSGVMFGMMHLGNPEIQEYGTPLLLLYSVLGIFLSAISALDGGIELAFGFHLANNLSAGILVTSKDQALQIPALFSTNSGSMDEQSVVFLLIGLTLFFLLFKRLFGWKIDSLIQNIP